LKIVAALAAMNRPHASSFGFSPSTTLNKKGPPMASLFYLVADLKGLEQFQDLKPVVRLY
jgi:hypothetical protein